MSASQPQFCAVCAWRQTCAKKFSVSDGGARCPDFTQDITIKSPPEPDENQEVRKEETP